MQCTYMHALNVGRNLLFVPLTLLSVVISKVVAVAALE